VFLRPKFCADSDFEVRFLSRGPEGVVLLGAKLGLQGMTVKIKVCKKCRAAHVSGGKFSAKTKFEVENLKILRF